MKRRDGSTCGPRPRVAIIALALASAALVTAPARAADPQEVPPLAAFSEGRHTFRLSLGTTHPVAQAGPDANKKVGGATVFYGALRDIQFGGGLEYSYRIKPNLALTLGLFGGDNSWWSGGAAYAGVTYRLLGLHERFYPVFFGGVFHQWGFPSNGIDNRTITALGYSLGAGVDVALNRKMLLGIQGIFELGAKVNPSVSAVALFRLSAGPTFLF